MLFGVAAVDGTQNAVIEFPAKGAFGIDKEPSLAIGAVARVFWDSTDGRLTTMATGNFQVGIAVLAALTDDPTARVVLLRVPSSGARGRAGAHRSPVFAISRDFRFRNRHGSRRRDHRHRHPGPTRCVRPAGRAGGMGRTRDPSARPTRACLYRVAHQRRRRAMNAAAAFPDRVVGDDAHADAGPVQRLGCTW